MADWIVGWPWLNQHAWIASALLVVAFCGAAATMWWHIHESHSRRYNYVGVVGLLLMACSFVLVGVSVGTSPIIPNNRLIPIIRILWIAVALIFNFYLLVYWSYRLRWKRCR